MSIRHPFIFLSLSVVGLLTACSPAPKSEPHPPSTKVTLTMRMVSPAPFQLGPHSSQFFLDMLTNQPVHSQISQMPALPMGAFRVGDAEYLWHGNGVIRGKGREELLWHGPYLQRLIAAVMREPHSSRAAVQRILDALEGDATVAGARVDGPGAYPGGGDALHPTRMGDPAGWKVFTPQTNKP